jgi:16S rRNA processing protein RimM
MIKIGRLGKAHGIQGAIKLKLLDDRFLDDLLQTEVVFVEKNGQKLPFFLEEVWGGPVLLLQFEEMDSRKAVEPFVSCFMYLREEDISGDEQDATESKSLDWGFLEGFVLRDVEEGLLGKIVRIEEFPQQEMAILEREGSELLIPLNEALIQSVDRENRSIIMELPSGLLDL